MTMTVREVAAARYRSLRRIRFPVDRLSIFVGPNGVGKTNLYRALQLLQAAAAGTLAREIAAEGGMESAIWAGERRKQDAARIVLSAELALSGADAHGYEVELGFPRPTDAAFPLEPQVKAEMLTFLEPGRSIKLLERRGPRGF